MYLTCLLRIGFKTLNNETVINLRHDKLFLLGVNALLKTTPVALPQRETGDES